MEPILIHKQEEWKFGGYLYSTVFSVSLNNKSLDEVDSCYKKLFEMAKASRDSRWIRGIAGYIIVPIYCLPANSVEGPPDHLEVTKKLFAELRWYFAVRFFPVVFDLATRTIQRKEAVQNHTILVYPHAQELIKIGCEAIAKRQ